MIRFGQSTVDVPSRSVDVDGRERHLEPQAFDLLVYLLNQRDRVVPKTELLDEVWGDQFVSESALTTRIKEVRRALGDDGVRQEVVRNVRGRGYRFVAVVNDEAGREPSSTERRAQPLATSLIGRDDDIASVNRMLDEAPLVSLVGPGGVGKTSLARDVVAMRRELHADGLFVVHLASVRDPAAIRHLIRRDTELGDAGATEADLVSAVAGLDALLVLDNCEHVIDEVARLVGAITNVNGRIRILATSRERIGLGVERVWPVEPLSAHMARRLLLERARCAQPGFELVPGSDMAVAELLDRLDRLPLAIEMAASRLSSLGLDDLLVLLRDRLDLLHTTDRSADERHRTISELIRWSEDLLDEQARDVLTCLSTFAGPALASDIASVAQVDRAQLVAGPLADCIDQSLVVVDTLHQPTTYRLLETVRASASRRTTPGHDARHANRIIDVAVEMDGVLRTPDEPIAARRLDALAPEMRVAHRWARDHEPERAAELTAALLHYSYERHWTEPVDWAAELMIALDSDDPGSLAAAAACAADAANRGDFERARSLGQRATASSDCRVVASAHDTLGNIGIYTGDSIAARHHYATLSTIGHQAEDAFVSANALIGQAMILAYDGCPHAALDHLAENPSTAPLSPTAAAWLAYVEADVLSALDRTTEAIALFERVARIGSAVGSTFVVSVAELSALAARSRTGEPDAARAAFVPVLKHYRRVRSTTHAITALRNLVVLLVRAGDGEDAMVLLGAVSNPGVKATYGAESRQLDEARAIVEERVGDDLVASWIASGAARDPMWAVDHAISVLS